MQDKFSFTSWALDHCEKAAFGVSLCGFGLLIFYHAQPGILGMHNVLIGTGLIGAIIGVYLWVRRRGNLIGKKERDIYLTITNKRDAWRMKCTSNNIVTILGEIWGFGQLLYFATHANTKPFSKYLDFNYYLQFTLFNVPSIPPPLLFLLSCLIPVCLASSFFFGWLVHNIIPLLQRKNEAFIAMGDEGLNLEQTENRLLAREENQEKQWNQFKSLLLKGTSIFYVGIFTQILLPLACVYENANDQSQGKCIELERFPFTVCSVICVLLVFPCNTYILTIGTQSSLRNATGEIIFISDSVLTFTLAELICSSVKVFFTKEQHQLTYLLCIAMIYAMLIVFMVHGRVTQQPACNSKAMFYFKVTNLACALAFTVTNLLGGYFPESRVTSEFALVYIIWPFFGALFLGYLLSFCGNNLQAFMFSVDLREMLKDRMIGCSVAVENDSHVPPRYTRMDKLAVFDSAGTPFHSSVSLFDKQFYLVAPYHAMKGPIYKEALMVPSSHVTEPIAIDQFDVSLLAGEIFRRYARKELRKFLKVTKREEYAISKHKPKYMDSMMELASREFFEENKESTTELLKISYPHLFIFLLEQREEACSISVEIREAEE